MKKLLLLAGILAVSGMTFAATETSDVTGKVDVKAEVVTQLEIVDTTPVDFGRIAAGQVDKVQETAGSFNIIGSFDRNIKITVRDENNNGAQYGDPTSGVNVILYQNGNKTNISNKQMISKLSLYSENGNVITSSPVALGTNIIVNNPLREQKKSKLKINVKGTLTAKDSQDIGNYNGILGIKAVYTDPVLNK